MVMSRTPVSIDLALSGPTPGTVLWQWLYQEIRAAILDGRLRRGMRLPATRELARQYGVSRGTAVTAFEQLHAEGYLEGKVGAGTNVNTRLPEDFLIAGSRSPPAVSTSRRSPRLSRLAGRLAPAPGPDLHCRARSGRSQQSTNSRLMSGHESRRAACAARPAHC